MIIQPTLKPRGDKKVIKLSEIKPFMAYPWYPWESNKELKDWAMLEYGIKLDGRKSIKAMLDELDKLV